MTLCVLISVYIQVSLEKVERFAFYERAKKAYAVVATGLVYFLCLHLSLGSARLSCIAKSALLCFKIKCRNGSVCKKERKRCSVLETILMIYLSVVVVFLFVFFIY